MEKTPTDVRLKIARTLKKYRERSGLTLREVGERIGKSNQTISAWEKGRGQPDADMFLKLCKVYNVESVGVFFGEEIQTPELPIDELELLEDWRNATDEAKRSARMVLKANRRPVMKKETAM